MIQSFGDAETRLIWEGRRSRKLPSGIQTIALRKRLLHAARVISDLRVPPGNRLESRNGNRLGQWSIRIDDQWRISFTWEDGGPHDVTILDYH